MAFLSLSLSLSFQGNLEDEVVLAETWMASSNADDQIATSFAEIYKLLEEIRERKREVQSLKKLTPKVVGQVSLSVFCLSLSRFNLLS